MPQWEQGTTARVTHGAAVPWATQELVLNHGSRVADAELLPEFRQGVSSPRSPPGRVLRQLRDPGPGWGGEGRSGAGALRQQGVEQPGARGRQAKQEPQAGSQNPGEHNSSPLRRGSPGRCKPRSVPPRAQRSLGTFTEGCRWTGPSGKQGAEPLRSLRCCLPLKVSRGDPGRMTQPQPQGSRPRHRPS